MATPRKFSTSLFPPIEIEIDDKKFSLKPINRHALELLEEITSKAKKNDLSFVSAFYDELALVLDAPKEYIDSLSVQTVFELTRYISEVLMKGGEEIEIKNAPTPGGSATP